MGKFIAALGGHQTSKFDLCVGDLCNPIKTSALGSAEATQAGATGPAIALPQVRTSVYPL